VPVRNDPPIRIQAKLLVGQTDDPAEHEADRIADQVMRMPDLRARPESRLSPANSDAVPPAPIQTKSLSAGDSAGFEAPPIVHDVLRSPGRPLDAATRAFFEPRLGHDFSNVRVHNDDDASESARQTQALAYTAGSHVVFRADQYQPHTAGGRQLLAHELAHVMQQPANGKAAVVRRQGDEHDPLEKVFDDIWKKSAVGNLSPVPSFAKKPIAPRTSDSRTSSKQQLLERVRKTPAVDFDLGKNIDWIRRDEQQARDDKLVQYPGSNGRPTSVQKDTGLKPTIIATPNGDFGGGLATTIRAMEFGGSIQYTPATKAWQPGVNMRWTIAGDKEKKKQDKMNRAMKLAKELEENNDLK
jgi:hypothetical protein